MPPCRTGPAYVSLLNIRVVRAEGRRPGKQRKQGNRENIGACYSISPMKRLPETVLASNHMLTIYWHRSEENIQRLVSSICQAANLYSPLCDGLASRIILIEYTRLSSTDDVIASCAPLFTEYFEEMAWLHVSYQVPRETCPLAPCQARRMQTGCPSNRLILRRRSWRLLTMECWHFG